MAKEPKVNVNAYRIAEIRQRMPSRPSQLRLSKKAGRSQGWLSPIEAGDTKPSESDARRLASAMGVPYKALFEPVGAPIEWLATADEDATASKTRRFLDDANFGALVEAILGRTLPDDTTGLTIAVKGESYLVGWVEMRDGQEWFVTAGGAWPVATLEFERVVTITRPEMAAHGAHTDTTRG